MGPSRIRARRDAVGVGVAVQPQHDVGEAVQQGENVGSAEHGFPGGAVVPAMQPDETLGGDRAPTRDLRRTSGTPAEPTTGELARIEAVLDQAFPRSDKPEPDDPDDDDVTFFDVDVTGGDLPAGGSPGTSDSPSSRPAPRSDQPRPERGWFMGRRPRRGQPPPR